MNYFIFLQAKLQLPAPAVAAPAAAAAASSVAGGRSRHESDPDADQELLAASIAPCAIASPAADGEAASVHLPPVSDEAVAECLAAFRDACGAHCDMDACASCGMICFGQAVQWIHLSELNALKLSDEAVATYHSSEPQRVHFTRHVHGDSVYYLHSQLVTADSKAPLCPTCLQSIRRMSVPSKNVKHVDFGQLGGDLELTRLEMEIVALSTLYRQEIKISKSGADGLKGHVCCFPHNGSDVLAALSNRNKEFPNVAAVRDQLRIVYVGEAKHWNELTKQAAARARFFKANPSFTVRPSVVLKFLRLKKELDPAYSNVVINDAPEVIEALAKLPDELLDRAIVSESLRARELEAHVNARYTAVTEPGPLYLSQAHDAAAPAVPAGSDGPAQPADPTAPSAVIVDNADDLDLDDLHFPPLQPSAEPAIPAALSDQPVDQQAIPLRESFVGPPPQAPAPCMPDVLASFGIATVTTCDCSPSTMP